MACKRASNRPDPAYRLHKPSGQAVVTLSDPTRGRKDHYLGPYGSPDSWRRYYELLATWRANGQRLAPEATGLTVTELVHRFAAWAERYYASAGGSQSSELEAYRTASRPLRELYGSTPAADFSPSKLELVQRSMIERGWVRSSINRQITRIRRIFAWGVRKELIPAGVADALKYVEGLRRGRTDAREAEPVRPVPEPYIEAVRPHVARQVWALIQLQLLTGARADELTRLTLADLDTSGDVWLYAPAEHKTAHHGHRRLIFIGPRGQGILREFMSGRATHQYLFSPREAEVERNAARPTHRRQPPAPPATDRRIGDRYTTDSYRRAIHRACDQAFPPPADLERIRVPGRGQRKSRWETPAEWQARLGPQKWAELQQWQADHRWSPHQLRHNAATFLRKEFGIEIAQLVLGHQIGSQITELYAEANAEKARQTIGRIG